MSDVFFFKFGTSPFAGLKRLLNQTHFLKQLSEGDSAAIKLHMGEKGNVRYLRPSLVRQVVDIVRSKGGKPFLFDTVAAYPGGRATREKYLKTAAINGFTISTIDAPIEIIDEKETFNVVPLLNIIEGCTLKDVLVPSRLHDADYLIVLSHVKGHELAGFGGALKNLGMGCVGTKTKQAQHMVNMPVLYNLESCDGCGKCARSCPANALKVVNGKIQKSMPECTSCATCLFECVSGCWEWPPDAKHDLQVNLAHSANAVYSSYQGHAVFINFIQDVVPQCDCQASFDLPVVQDIGILVSSDPVAIDKASLDLIDKAPLLPGFAERLSGPDVLGKMHATSSLIQLEVAHKLKMGDLEYELLPV
jgi:uncharacterized protein